jgi:hypothetical protein
MTVGSSLDSAVSGTWAIFADANRDDDATSYSATINWGDGSSSTAGTVTGFDGQFVVTGSHTYASKGVYSVSVSVSAADGREVPRQARRVWATSSQARRVH